LQKDPEKRIGVKDTYDIAKHPWFKEINWDALKKLELEPPIKPEVKDKFDTENFNKELMKES
jgi:hypothetical protein